MKKLAAFITALVATTPAFAFAAEGNFDNIFRAVDTVMGLITKLIPIVIGAAVLLFLFGILKFVFAGDDESRKAARGFMILGIVALAVMVSVWGLVRFLQSTFGLENSQEAIQPPKIPVYGR
ncbi:MAG: hypothetical protein RLY57_730 [Candidatus Parcubacteria bacterium]|jgi:uncharacterized membrane-anchored protein